MDDIVIRLRQFVKRCNHDWNLGNEWYPAPMECVSCIRQRDAADEIERLRELAYLLIDELRFNGGYEAYTPKMLFDEFYEQAVRGE